MTIARRFSIEDLTLHVHGLAIPFIRPADPDAVLDMAVARESAGLPTTVPYWAAAWESAAALAAALPPPTPQQSNLLDLGCGTGHVGTIAAAMGYRVTLTDNEAHALLFARYNSLPFHASVRRIDWNTDTLPHRFRTIAGSDVIYDRTQWPGVLAFCRRHLDDRGTLMLAEPRRHTAEAFQAFAADEGWQMTVADTQPIRLFHLTL